MPRLTVGLTGGIASGKSLVADAFAARGVPVLDADTVARDVVAPPSPALAEIAGEFGPQALLPDGTLDRRWMRQRVFGDAPALRRLEAITHPAIFARLRAWRDAQTAPYCMLMVPILLEAGQGALVDRVLVVDAPESLQLQRLTGRDGIDAELARRMMAAQLPRGQRLALAHDVIDNGAAIAAVDAQVERLHRRYCALAAQPGRAAGEHGQ